MNKNKDHKQFATVPLGALVEPKMNFLGLITYPDIGICLGQEKPNDLNCYYNNIFFIKNNIIMLMNDIEVTILKETK